MISHDLLERGSELFIAKTLIHEMIHAYFKMELQRDGLEEGMGDFVSDFAKILEDQGLSSRACNDDQICRSFSRVISCL